MAFSCTGNGEDHCCWLNGVVCPFLQENVEPGRRWSCGLRVELGDWDKVHSDPRYLAVVRPVWDRFDVPDCGDFVPRPNECCWEGD